MASIVGYIAGARNEIPNPSFEVNTTGWANQNGSIATDTAWAFVGLRSCKQTATAGAVDTFINTPILVSDANRIVAVPGDMFSVKIRVKNSSPGVRWFRAQLTARTSASVTISTQVGDTVSVPAGGTITYTYNFPNGQPATTAYVYLVCMWAGTGVANPVAAGDIFYYDGIDLRKAEGVDSYIDGSQGSGYAWTGTANLSPSTRAAKPIYGSAGRSGQILIEPQLFKTDKYNNIGEDISQYILSGSIEMKTDREIKMQFNGTLFGANKILAYTDYVAPFMKLTYPDGSIIYEQLGIYSIAPPGETWTTDYVTGEFKGYDLTWNLSEASWGVPFNVFAGTKVVDSMRWILNNQGFTRWAIPDHAATFVTTRTWQTDKSILQILNDHAEMIGFYTFHSDRAGIWQSFPYNDIENIEPAVLLYSGSGSTVVGAIKREPNPDGLVNMVRVLKEGAADGASITYTQTNSNPTSKVSTTSLGRIKFREIKVQDLASLAVAKEIARKTLADAAGLYYRYQIQTLPDPRRNVWEVYDTLIYMDDGTEVISGKVRCTGWDIGFTPQSAIMTHHCSRVEPFE